MLPVVGRELLVSARRPASYWTRSGFVGLLILLVSLVVWSPIWSRAGGLQGVAFFIISAILLFCYSLLSGVVLTADCLSSERREGTLPLLFLTDLKASHVVLGKMICSSIQGFYFFLAVVPALSIGFLFGGIEWHLVLFMLSVLLGTLVVSLELGVFVSARSLLERKAMMGTLLALIAWVLGPLILEQLFLGRSMFDALGDPVQNLTIGFLSPITQVSAVANTGVRVTGKILMGMAGSQILGLLLLRWASRRLSTSKTGDKNPAVPKSRTQASRSERQRTYRAQLLDKAPTMWLTARQPWKGYVAILFTLTVLAVVVASWILADNSDGRLTMLMAGIAALGFFFKVWVLFEACQRSFEDRQSGALELLLTTPIIVREMASGFHRALRGWFRFALLLPCLFFVCCVFFLWPNLTSVGLRNSTLWFLAEVISGAVDLWALAWVGLWEAARSRSTLRAVSRAVLLIFVLPFAVYMMLILFEGVLTMFFPSNDWFEWFSQSFYVSLSLAVSLWAGRRARRLYLNTLREVAAARFESPHQARGASFRERVISAFRLVFCLPGMILRWLKAHPCWTFLLGAVLTLVVLYLLYIRALDRQVAQRIEEIAATGWSVDYSIDRITRARGIASAKPEVSWALRELRSAYQDFGRQRPRDSGMDPLTIPAPLVAMPTNQVASMRLHLGRNAAYLKLLRDVSAGGWIDMSSVDSEQTLLLQPQDLDMLAWQGLIPIEENDPVTAIRTVDELLDIGLLHLGSHRSRALLIACRSYHRAAQLSERIVARTSADAEVLQRLQSTWEKGEAATDVEPDLQLAFAKTAAAWDSTASSAVFDSAQFGRDDLLHLRVVRTTEYLQGSHQRDTLSFLETFNDPLFWKRLISSMDPIYASPDDPDLIYDGSFNSRSELSRIIDNRREILAYSRTARVALELRLQQLAQPSAGRSALLKASTNSPALRSFAPAFRYLWEAQGLTVNMGSKPVNSFDTRNWLGFELRRRDWVEPAP